ncbi:Protein DCL, chloroplastic [Olea europaea subsp. europaea]|uniref:Protein DCL, chloroplastic n=1 Tax=Olea europaea subsp. europaea TaxID=158383 RepID=A0A8S0QBJ0_OLEEU|nr:Protein DCL, chloroplastic [Olea europaea subsp. europaea]
MDAEEPTGRKPAGKDSKRDRIRVKRKTLEVVLKQCQIALQELTDDSDDDDADGDLDDLPDFIYSSSSPYCDAETAEFCDILQSMIEGTDFVDKLENAHASLSHNMAEEGSS